MPYIANTKQDQQRMLSAVGCASIEELWAEAQVTCPPPELKSLPEGMSEYEVVCRLRRLAAKNATNLVNFIGGGYYDHLIPAAVGAITGRSEFYTAYTPYQPEASQGTLQAIFEYQSMICRLTGMPVANASLYDGGTAMFEAMMLAVRVSRKRKAIISEAVSPIFRKMLECYSFNLDVELVTVPAPEGTSSNPQGLIDALDDDSACLIVQYPNAFGDVEDWSKVIAKAHEKKALAICSTYPVALSLLKSPGEMGFDVVTGEGQSLGIPLSFGGPYLGFMAVSEVLVRKMPGRVVGRAHDAAGKEGFVLTLQTREQHIRREGATSNICSNENLCALSALAYLSCLGKEGFREVGLLSAANAVYCREQLLKIKGVEAVGSGCFFNEFIVRLPIDAAEAAGRMIDRGFAAGFPLGRYYANRQDQLLIAVTEKRTREEMNALANALETLLCN